MPIPLEFAMPKYACWQQTACQLEPFLQSCLNIFVVQELVVIVLCLQLLNDAKFISCTTDFRTSLRVSIHLHVGAIGLPVMQEKLQQVVTFIVITHLGEQPSPPVIDNTFVLQACSHGSFPCAVQRLEIRMPPKSKPLASPSHIRNVNGGIQLSKNIIPNRDVNFIRQFEVSLEHLVYMAWTLPYQANASFCKIADVRMGVRQFAVNTPSNGFWMDPQSRCPQMGNLIVHIRSGSNCVLARNRISFSLARSFRDMSNLFARSQTVQDRFCGSPDSSIFFQSMRFRGSAI
jgi:hypothetical protein